MSEPAVYKALVDHSSDILAVVDDADRIASVNPAIETVLGVAVSEALGRRVDEMVHPNDRAMLEEALHAAREGGGPHSAELRFRAARDSSAPETSWLWLDVCARRPAGLSGVVVDARDVTASRQARQALLDSEERYRSLFESSRDAICIGTLDGRLLDANPAAVRLFGYDSKEELLACDIQRDLYWNPQDRKRAEATFLAQGYVESFELQLKTKDGRRLRVLETASAVRDEAGELIGFRGILRDVSEHRRLEEQLRQSQKMEAVGRLAGGVAHDFNNLLTAINGYGELALARMADDDPLRPAILEIRKAGKRATDLTRRLLTLSRHQVVSPRRIDLNRCVQDMEKLLQRVIGEDIELQTQLDAELPRIFADQGQLEQVVLNLAVNARDAMPNGGHLALETRAVTLPGPQIAAPPQAPDGEYVLLTVRDTGVGMKKAVREHAFEPFFTTKGQGHNTGLGLAIVYGIVRQSDGYIEIDSREGEGTIFRLFFPIDSARSAPPTEAAPRPSAPLPRGDETVLLVEDEPSVRTLVRQILDLQGYEVLAARHADAAEAICDGLETPPDLLLTDVVMPGRSGLALAEGLKGRYGELRILFMSGYTDSHVGVKMITERDAAFLAKPFTPEALTRKVREVLDA